MFCVSLFFFFGHKHFISTFILIQFFCFNFIAFFSKSFRSYFVWMNLSLLLGLAYGVCQQRERRQKKSNLFALVLAKICHFLLYFHVTWILMWFILQKICISLTQSARVSFSLSLTLPHSLSLPKRNIAWNCSWTIVRRTNICAVLMCLM